jgi:HK97 family phage portal protein
MEIFDKDKYKSDAPAKEKPISGNESNTLFGQTALGNNIIRQAGSDKNIAGSQLLYVTTSASSESGRIVDMSTLARNSTVMTCIALKARVLAQLPIQIMYENDNGELVNACTNPDVNPRDKTKARSVYKLLNNPNKFQSAYEFWVQWLLWYELAGESFVVFWRKDRKAISQTPSEMYLLDSTLITAQITAGRYPTYRLSTPSYGFSKDEPLQPHEVVHAKELAWQGSAGFNKGILATTLVGIDQDLDLYASFVLQNGAKPTGMFYTDAVIPDSKYKEIAARLKNAWANMLGSRTTDTSKPGQGILLDNGMKYEALKMLTMQDTDAAKLKEQTMVRIAAMFGVPHQLINIGQSKFNNTQTLLDEFYKSTMLPIVINVQQKFGTALLDGYPSLSIRFQTDEFLKGAPLDQMNYAVSGVKNGILTPNEGRAHLGRATHDSPEADKLQEPKGGSDDMSGQSPQDTGGGGNTDTIGRTGRDGNA